MAFIKNVLPGVADQPKVVRQPATGLYLCATKEQTAKGDTFYLSSEGDTAARAFIGWVLMKVKYSPQD